MPVSPDELSKITEESLAGTPAQQGGPDSATPAYSEPAGTERASEPGPLAGSQEPGQQSAQQSAAQRSASLRDTAKQYGADLSQFQSDDDALKYLVEQAGQRQAIEARLREEQGLAKYGREYLSHAGEFQNFLQSKQAQSQKQAEEKFWNPPEWDPAWLSKVTRGEDGKLVPLYDKGGSEALIKKIYDYAEWRESTLDKFLHQGPEFLAPAIKKMAADQAREIVQSTLQEKMGELDARHFLAMNRDWLYEKDQNGSPLFGHLSQQGKIFQESLRRAEELEKLTPAARSQQVAMELMRLAGVQPGTQPGLQPGQQPDKKTAFLKNAAQQTAPIATSATSSPTSGIAQGPTKGSLYDQMVADLKANGYDLNDKVPV